MIGDPRPYSERVRPGGIPVLRADERFVEQLADTLAERVADRLQGQGGDEGGYLNAEAAGRYIGVSRRRIHNLTSAGLLIPDGHDGRTPLYRRRTLDDYVAKARERP
jgi:hypothetical protein